MGGRLNSRRTWVPGRSMQRFELAGVDTEITLEVAVHVEDAAFLARQREMREPRLAHAALGGLEDRDVLRDDASTGRVSRHDDFDRPCARRVRRRRPVEGVREELGM